MANHMSLILKEVPSDRLRASATAVNVAVAVTDDDLIVAKAGLFSKKLDRIPLAKLKSVRFTPNPHSDLLALEFRDADDMTLMFGPDAKQDAESLAQVLQAHLVAARS